MFLRWAPTSNCCSVVFIAIFSKQGQHKGVNGTPEGAYDRLLCNLSTSWLVASPPASTGFATRWENATGHHWQSIHQPIFADTCGLFCQKCRHTTTLSHALSLFRICGQLCVFLSHRRQKVAIFLICSSAGDGRRRQQRTNKTAAETFFQKTSGHEAFARRKFSNWTY